MWKFGKIFFEALLISAVLTPVMMVVARNLGALDHPKERGMHKKATPLLGGVAMYLSFVASVLIQLDYSVQLKGVLIASSIIFFVGLLDDLFDLRASLKLIGQVIACVVLMEHGVVLQVLHYQSLNVLCTVVGVIGITNAANFLDNMDGLAAGLIAISAFIFFAIAAQTQQNWLGYLAMGLSGSCCGFLIFNFKPAKIFMGDCGATFAGFTLASLAVLGKWADSIPSAIAIPVLVLGIFIFDMFMITVLRIKTKKVHNFRQWLEYAGKDHLSHRLHDMGLSDRQAVLGVYLICSILGYGAYAVHVSSLKAGVLGWLALGAYVISCLFGTYLLDGQSKMQRKGGS